MAAESDPREARAAFLLHLRARGVSDLSVLRALETAPREHFVPHRYVDLANRDIALPIACGQTMPEPFFVARMMEALQLQPSMTALEIGSGSGYATAILARLVRDVIGVERYQSLAIAAKARLQKLEIANAAVLWADGLDLPADLGPFDRILVHAAIDGHEADMRALLAPGGLLVAGFGAPQRLTRWRKDGAGQFSATPLGSSRLSPLAKGRARVM